MSAQPLIIANWKMKLGVKQSHELAHAIAREPRIEAQVVLCPSYPSLVVVSQAIHRTTIALGAQDCFWEARGTYTGEVSYEDLTEVGAQYVIVGHSERRKYLGETDEMINRKTQAVLQAGLIPIVCVGETFDERQQGSRDYVLIQQVTKALENVSVGTNQKLVVAYEPVWAISPGLPIEPSEAESAHQVVYQTLIDVLGSQTVMNNVHIIYGGSVNAANVQSFINLAHTSGVLVGSASLHADEFIALIQNV